jgi:hypothetical protein
MWLYDSDEKASRTQKPISFASYPDCNKSRAHFIVIHYCKGRAVASQPLFQTFLSFFPIRYQKRGDKRGQLLPTPVTPLLLFSLRWVAGRVREFMYFDAAATDVLHILDPFGARNVTKN